MKILMIAPEPFFEPRGTPFSEYYRIRTLCSLGHEVDLVTYPVGEDREVEGLKIFRTLRPFWIKSVKTGPSGAKLVLDFLLFFSALRRLLFHRYHVIHTHEEASFFGAILGKVFRVPHLYDMHSSLVQQMDNFKFTKSGFITGFFRFIEKQALRSARSVIVICRSLYDYAATVTDKNKLTIIENFIDDTPDSLDSDTLKKMSARIPVKNKKIVTYTGTLETYQGIPLLIDSLTHLSPDFHLLLVGGKPEQISRLKEQIESRNLSARITMLGRRPFHEIPYLLQLSDVLVSPRSLGTNIPLKIYSYLKSGVPVVATNLYTHTQSINSEISILVEPEPRSLARGIMHAASREGQKIATAARAFCQKNYSEEKYRELVLQALEPVSRRQNKEQQ